MIETANCRTGKLKAVLDSKFDTPADKGDVNTPWKGGYYAMYYRESLRVEITPWC